MQASPATSSYILIAIQLEEHDLVREYGTAYEDYRRRVPMLVPSILRRDPARKTARVQPT